MLSQTKPLLHLSNPSAVERKEDIIGFFVLCDGTFVKIHNDSKVELINKKSSQWVTQMKKIPYFEEVGTCLDSEVLTGTRIIELTETTLVILYTFYSNHSCIVMIDREKSKCLAGIGINHNINFAEYYSEITHLSKFNNNSMLAEFGYDKNKLISLNKNSEGNYTINVTDAKDLPYRRLYQFPDKSGFIHYNRSGNCPITQLNNEFKKIEQIELAPNYDPCDVIKRFAQINYFTFISSEYFACIVNKPNDRKILIFTEENNYLYFFMKNLTLIKSIKLDKTFLPRKLIALNQNHVAIVGKNSKLREELPLIVKVYNLNGKCINEFEHYPKTFISATSDGQIATCDRNGAITVHQVLPHKIIKNELEAHLPKVLAEITTEYLGFFNKGSISPQDNYPQKSVSMHKCSL